MISTIIPPVVMASISHWGQFCVPRQRIIAYAGDFSDEEMQKSWAVPGAIVWMKHDERNLTYEDAY